MYNRACAGTWQSNGTWQLSTASCTPLACASGPADLGTQNIPNSVHTETEYSHAHDANTMGGWSEPVCAILPK